MLKSRRLWLGLAAVWALAAAGLLAQAGTTVYVKPATADVRQSTSPTSPVVASVPKGTALRVVEAVGARFRVQLPDGRSGFIARLNTTPDRPATGGNSGLGGMVRNSNTGEQGSGGAIRGLHPINDRYAKEGVVSPTAVADTEAMNRMPASVSAEDVDRFLAEGKVEAP